MSIYLQQALPRVVIHRTQVIKKIWTLRLRFRPKKGQPRASNEDFYEV